MKLSTLVTQTLCLLMLIGPSISAQADSFDSSTGVLKLNLVTVGSNKYTVELHLEDDGKLKILSAVPAAIQKVYSASTTQIVGDLAQRL